LDEDHFFGWLRQIPAVKTFAGSGTVLTIECDPGLMTDDALRELLALFFRYGVDTTQLDVFVTDKNRGWFMNEHAYWRSGRRA
jgi:hypothetical protein